jgi:ribonuclease G
MSPNTLVINCDLRETRVALIEDGVIAELQIERAAHRGTVGNIVLGRVTRVLPGMQAAFIDVGMERAAFLHVEDLIRPDDFEAYLSGDFGEIDKSESGKDLAKGGEEEDVPESGPSEPPRTSVIPAALAEDDGDDDDEELIAESDDEDDDLDDDEDDLEDEDDDEESGVDSDSGDSSPDANGDDDLEDEGDDDLEDEDDDLEDEDDDLEDEDDGEEEDEEPEELDDDPDDDEEEEEEEELRARRKRRRRKTNDRARKNGGSERRASRETREASSSNGRSRDDARKSSRVSRSIPITDVVKEGDAVIVQISKEPIGTKGARVTSHVSLPGRYCVFLPTVDHVGISKRIGSASERARLREVINGMKPKTGGVIVRTVAAGLTKKALKADLGYLMRLWNDVSKKVESAKAPCLLYAELDLVLKTARDLFTDEIGKIVIDDREQYARLIRFVEMFLPERVKDIELYQGDEPVFDAYGIEDEIARALSRKVPLKSGGYLIIDQAEALTAIDVNTGRFVGKGQSNLEETALMTNLEAVDEIAYQLRFRNVGGLVVLDLIDMENRANREKVYRALDLALKKDKAKTTINRISDLGLIEMTRKRTRESLSRTLNEPCFYCDGTGHIQSRTTIAYEILRQVRRERSSLPGYTITVNAHPAVIDTLQGEERVAVKEAEARYMRRIKLVPRKEYHIEQYDLKGE